MNLKNKIIAAAFGLLLLIVTVSSVVGWYRAINRPVLSRTEFLPAPPMKPVVKIKKVPVPGPATVEVIDKTQLIKKIDMPEGFKNDPNKQALATASIPKYSGTTSVVSTLDIKSGVGEILVKQEPLSLLGFVNEKELYARAGYSTSKETQLSVGARWQFVRIGKIKIGAYAEGRSSFSSDETKSTGEAVAGLEVSY